jgi:hypothetical protein
MGFIDRKRITAVVALEEMGFVFDGLQWQRLAAGPGARVHHGEAMQGLAHLRAEADEHSRLIEAGEAYAHALAEGKVLGGIG